MGGTEAPKESAMAELRDAGGGDPAITKRTLVREALEAVRPMVARLLGSSYPDRSFVHALGLEVPEALEAVLKQRDRALTTANAHLVPDELVMAYTWAGTAEQVAEQVAPVADLGIRNITFMPHPLKGGGIESTVRAFAEQVRPRVEALLRG